MFHPAVLDALIDEWTAAWRDAQREAPAWVEQWSALAVRLGLPHDTAERVSGWMATVGVEGHDVRSWLEQLRAASVEGEAARRVQVAAGRLSEALVELAMRPKTAPVALDEWAAPWLERLSAALVDASMRGFPHRTPGDPDDAPRD